MESEPRPTHADVQRMCCRIGLTPAGLPDEPFGEFLRALRKSHKFGGAHLVAFEVPPDNVFDWFASRNQLSEESLIDSLLSHPAIRQALPDLKIPEAKAKSGLSLANPFLLDARFAHALHYGGAYWEPPDKGKSAKTLAVKVCESMFDLRYGEIVLLESSDAWTPWFGDIAWDHTAVVFDPQLRRLWLFAGTDTD
jgi:hypothetical protein